MPGDEQLRQRLQDGMAGYLPGMIGIELLRAGPGEVDARLELRRELLAPNDYLHAATVIALADSAAGMGCIASLPEGKDGFTTIELKTNFLRTARDGALRCEARLVHAGRTTQVWDATVTREEDGEPLALFRCTQYLLADGRGRRSVPVGSQ